MVRLVRFDLPSPHGSSEPRNTAPPDADARLDAALDAAREAAFSLSSSLPSQYSDAPDDIEAPPCHADSCVR